MARVAILWPDGTGARGHHAFAGNGRAGADILGRHHHVVVLDASRMVVPPRLIWFILVSLRACGSLDARRVDDIPHRAMWSL